MTTPSLQDLGKQPIPGPLVAGSELREEPEFEALESEIAKLSSPVHSSTLDWRKVNQIALELLATKGKDMLVASYLSKSCYGNQCNSCYTNVTVGYIGAENYFTG